MDRFTEDFNLHTICRHVDHPKFQNAILPFIVDMLEHEQNGYTRIMADALAMSDFITENFGDLLKEAEEDLGPCWDGSNVDACVLTLILAINRYNYQKFLM